MHILAKQFSSALGFIEIKGAWRDYASDAQAEIRTHLEGDATLKQWGLETVVIGSYGRGTAIWPGKDVDVFAKLSALKVGDIDPGAIFDHVRDGLLAAYGDRAEPQHRSVKVSFDREGFEFSVDVVPAVRWEDRWAIPTRDVEQWSQSDDDRWVATDPEQLGTLTTEANRLLTVGSQGAYVPTVKLLRQTRSSHCGKHKPGGFYFELMAYQAFASREVSGDSFSEIFGGTLESVARQLAAGVVTDPVLGGAYAPEPDAGDRLQAAAVFSGLAEQARRAITTDDLCEAGALWGEILGTNDKGRCFPPPDGCDEHGRRLAVSAPAVSRGSREPGGFA